MTKQENTIAYAAFLRGIGPGDPKKSNESLRKVFEACGFLNVRSFISSGNILFESSEKDASKLEKKAEKMFRDSLDIEVATFVRSKGELETFLQQRPFGKLTHSNKTYLVITFLKKSANAQAVAPLLKEKKIPIKNYDVKLQALYSVVDNTGESKTPNFMVALEKALGKDITTRTLNTVQRITDRL